MEFIIDLFGLYGYSVLLFALMLELIALPLPGQTLMTYCGYVVSLGKMAWSTSIIFAATGTITGITISYFIGKTLGISFFERYGHYIHLNKKRIDKFAFWYKRYGSVLLVVSYFIPGVRHVTGYFSGISDMTYKKFATYSYVGALIWAFTFITLGKVFGENWEKYYDLATKYLGTAGFIIVILVVLIYIYVNYKQKLHKWIRKIK